MHLLPEIKEVKAAPDSNILKLYASSYILNLHTQNTFFKNTVFTFPIMCVSIYTSVAACTVSSTFLSIMSSKLYILEIKFLPFLSGCFLCFFPVFDACSQHVGWSSV